jgi:hypothetical protein
MQGGSEVIGERGIEDILKSINAEVCSLLTLLGRVCMYVCVCVCVYTFQNP